MSFEFYISLVSFSIYSGKGGDYKQEVDSILSNPYHLARLPPSRINVVLEIIQLISSCELSLLMKLLNNFLNSLEFSPPRCSKNLHKIRCGEEATVIFSYLDFNPLSIMLALIF